MLDTVRLSACRVSLVENLWSTAFNKSLASSRYNLSDHIRSDFREELEYVSEVLNSSVKVTQIFPFRKSLSLESYRLLFQL